MAAKIEDWGGLPHPLCHPLRARELQLTIIIGIHIQRFVCEVAIIIRSASNSNIISLISPNIAISYHSLYCRKQLPFISTCL